MSEYVEISSIELDQNTELIFIFKSKFFFVYRKAKDKHKEYIGYLDPKNGIFGPDDTTKYTIKDLRLISDKLEEWVLRYNHNMSNPVQYSIKI